MAASGLVDLILFVQKELGPKWTSLPAWKLLVVCRPKFCEPGINEGTFIKMLERVAHENGEHQACSTARCVEAGRLHDERNANK